MLFCHGIFVSTWRGQVALRIKNPTTRLFYAFNKLSNETSVVSGDLFFMEMSKFEVQNSFLSCCFVMASLSQHGEAKSLYELKIRQSGCFMHSTSFLMRPQSFLGTYFSWRFRNFKVKIRFCHVILSWRLVSPWRGQGALRIENPTMRLFYAFNKLSNETSFVSGDLFFMEISKF
jgi:hypothetical protein